MNTILRYAFIALYAGAVFLLLVQIWIYVGLSYDPLVCIFIYAIWLFICFTGYTWRGSIFLARKRVRKTILEEEEWLHPIMHELNLRTSIQPQPELLILEDPGLDAFALGKKTVVLSRGLIVRLSEFEIKAVLAHEFGHLKNRDTLAGSAFGMAYAVPLNLHRLLRIFFGFIKKWFWKKGGLPTKLLFTVLLAFAIFQYPDLVVLITILFIFMKVFPFAQLIVMGLWCYFSRAHEFQQDQFAQALGCGKYLKSALLKIDALNGSLVNPVTQLWLNHPMLYMRIRRLEWLEGLRSSP